MEAIFYRSLNCKIGNILLASSNKGVCYLGFLKDKESQAEIHAKLEKVLGKCHLVNEDLEGYKSDINQKALEELQLYFEKKLKGFTVPLDLRGTEFQKKVWNELIKIPYGSTKSYKEVAEAVGKPKACRAVGGANHNNPVSIIVPCHRVIGKNGSLVGYGGGLTVKSYLLQLEGAHTK